MAGEIKYRIGFFSRFVVYYMKVKAPFRRFAPLAVLIASLYCVSCDLGTSVLSSDELERLYTTKLSLNGKDLAYGAALPRNALAMELSIKAKPDAPDPATLEVILLDADGLRQGGGSFRDASYRGMEGTEEETEAGTAGDIPVYIELDDILDGKIPIRIDMPDGYYFLETVLRDDAGVKLFSDRKLFLVYRGEPIVPTVSVHPGSVGTGSAALFKLRGLPATGPSPWIQWTVDGVVAAEGYADEGHDRLVWRASGIPDLHSVSAAVYPFRPPLVRNIPPYARNDSLAFPVKAQAEGQNDWSDDYEWALRVPLRGAFSVADAVAGVHGARVLGNPYPEELEGWSGFSYAFESGAGLFLPRASADGRKPPAFVSMACTVAALPSGYRLEDSSGMLVGRYDADGGELVALGLEKGRPYARIGGAVLEPNGYSSGKTLALALTLEARKDGLFAVLYAGGEPIASGVSSLSMEVLSASGHTVLAGEDGLSALYLDYAELEGAYPAYRAALAAKHGRKLLLAEGFDTGMLPDSWRADGDYSVAPIASAAPRIVLYRGTRLDPLTPLPPDGRLRLSIRREGAPADLTLLFPLDRDGRFLELRGDGVALLDGKQQIGSLGVDAASAVELGMDIENGSLFLGSDSVKLPEALRFAAFPSVYSRDRIAVRSVAAWRE